MADQSEPEVVEHLVRVQEELGRLGKLAKIELAEREEFVAVIREFQTWVKSEVKLDLQSLGYAFVGDKEAYLDADCNLVIVGEKGGITKKPLEQLDPALFLIVARAATPRLLKLISSRTSPVKEQPKPPAIRVILLAGKKASDSGSGGTHHFFVMNHGGEVQELVVSVRPMFSIGTYGRADAYGPLKLRSGEQIELNLRQPKESTGLASLAIEMACKGVDGRVYRGRSALLVESRQWLEIDLSAS